MIPAPEWWIACRYAGVTAGAGDGDRWREAAALRQQCPGWVVIWLAPIGRFRAYRRMPGARRDTALSASTFGEMADLIGQAEQVAQAPVPGREGS